jgi:predicted phage-related endonuclease
MSQLIRQQWLEQRKTSIGASEAGCIIEINGDPINPFADAYSVYASKVLGYEVPDNIHMATGRMDEPGMAYQYEMETGREVFDPGDTHVDRSFDWDFITATPDRYINDTRQHPAPKGCFGRGVLELKDVSPAWYPHYVDCEQQYRKDPLTGISRLCYVTHRDPAEEWAKNPPMHYQVQLQMQMYCSGLEWGSLCGKFPGREIAWRDYPRKDNFLAWAIPQLVRFWDRVERRDPPPIRYERTADVVKLVYTEATGETVIIDSDTELAALEWEKIKAEIRVLDKQKKILWNQIMAKLGNGNWADLSDGRFLKRRLNKKGYFDLSIVKYKK